MADRYEINHSGEIVVGESALCADQTKMLQDLFSQYGWSCTEEGKEGSCHKLRLEHSSCDSRTINVYSGTIRNESRREQHFLKGASKTVVAIQKSARNLMNME